jgi:hypothetical protein
MIYKYGLFILICIIGEILVNVIWFRYLKKKFSVQTSGEDPPVVAKTILKFDISTFKGIMERLIMATCLAIGLTPILIVFGALKIGTRLKSPDDKIQNDYFLIGNLSSIFISVMYVYIFQEIWLGR